MRNLISCVSSKNQVLVLIIEVIKSHFSEPRLKIKSNNEKFNLKKRKEFFFFFCYHESFKIMSQNKNRREMCYRSTGRIAISTSFLSEASSKPFVRECSLQRLSRLTLQGGLDKQWLVSTVRYPPPPLPTPTAVFHFTTTAVTFA